MRTLACLTVLLVASSGCTQTSSLRPGLAGRGGTPYVDTETNCPAGSPWWCSGYRESGR